VVKYLLDTNIVSELVRRPQGVIADRIAAVGEENVCTSVVVAAELRYGAAKRSSAALTAQVEAVLDVLEVVPLEPPMDRTYATVRTALEARGTPIGGNDLLIAAHALALGCTLVTDNVGEFSRVESLAHENWFERGPGHGGRKAR
jgi:tRNA(fMet)-specific endonuclease VapC